MHELSVVFYVIKDVKKVMKENNVKTVKTISLDIGEVSTVIPHYLLDIWKWARKKETGFENCNLKINTVKAVTYCVNCKKEYETITYGKICPFCKSKNTYLKEGNDLEIKEIEV